MHKKLLLLMLICSSPLFAPPHKKKRRAATRMLIFLNKTNQDVFVKTGNNTHPKSGHYVRRGTRQAIVTRRDTSQVTIGEKTFTFDPTAKQLTIDWSWDKYTSGLAISEQY